MALIWGLNKIKDYEKVCFVENKGNNELNHKTYALIWYTLGIDMGEITPITVEEFWERVRIYEKVTGSSMVGADMKDIYLTRDDIVAHIGLYTNVGYKDRKYFVDKIARRALEKFVRPLPSNKSLIENEKRYADGEYDEVEEEDDDFTKRDGWPGDVMPIDSNDG